MLDATNFKIIVIDDNPQIHQDFIQILKTESSFELDKLKAEIFGASTSEIKSGLPSFQIDVASQGQEGVARIKQALQAGSPYSLAFVDIRMPPGWDGIETIKRIWELDKNIQIVICTAYSDYSWEETVAHLGKTDNLLILKKPFDNVSVRQLAYALTRKWKLAADSRDYTASLQEQVAERTQALEYQATHDSLTGLMNRVKLLDKLRAVIKSSQDDKSSFVVLFIDLDRFKLINDSLSHGAGDKILIEATKRLQRALHVEDTLARLGGDEFVILITNIIKQNDLVEKINNILETFKEPFHINDRLITLTASIGAAQYPKDGNTVDVLLRNADVAMYRAKAQKGNTFQIYSDEMSMESLAELDQEMELRQAIANEEFFLVFQPQINLQSNKIEAVEALIRWNHPDKGVLLPIDFIPVAEETGLIVPICEWVMRKACQQNKLWQTMGYTPIRMAVNVTAQQFKQGNLVETIDRILKETKLEPKYLEIELTENVILSDCEVMKTVSELKKLGVILAVDDFGTGYSSLSYLRKIPLDRLKIDSSYIQHIKTVSDDEVIIKAVIAMAHNLNLEVLAEGVETIDQLNFLRENKCKEVQGFYFSKPLNENEIENYFKEGTDASKIEKLIAK